MGREQKVKAARKAEEAKRAGTTRLQLVQIRAEIVSYNDEGKVSNRGVTDPLVLFEADIPAELVDLLRSKGIQFDVPAAAPPTPGS